MADNKGMSVWRLRFPDGTFKAGHCDSWAEMEALRQKMLARWCQCDKRALEQAEIVEARWPN